VDVLGVHVNAIDMTSAVSTVRRWVETEAREYVCVTGVHGVMECQRDPALTAIHNAAGMVTPDGMPMVWSGRWAGAAGTTRVYGPDLMLAVCELAAQRGWPSFFYGGREGIADLFASRLRSRFAGLPVAGTYTPPFRPMTEHEDDGIVRRINDSGAKLVWVGLSTPKQERWMAAHRQHLDAPVLFGVGAAFDIHAGVLPQAPPWMQSSGLEWLYRLTREPKRLWRRYLYSNPRFLAGVLRHPPKLLG
jgi:N-acetylglucosaminyldiphosphoundecaprenol N-acetyl-beta-D-mannosaminyltransferase